MADEEPANAVAAAETFVPPEAVDPECIVWIKSKVHIATDTEIVWTQQNDDNITEFCASVTERRLFVYWDGDVASLVVSVAPPPATIGAARLSEPMSVCSRDMFERAAVGRDAIFVTAGGSRPLLSLAANGWQKNRPTVTPDDTL